MFGIKVKPPRGSVFGVHGSKRPHDAMSSKVGILLVMHVSPNREVLKGGGRGIGLCQLEIWIV